jgi:hypothetical protein
MSDKNREPLIDIPDAPHSQPFVNMRYYNNGDQVDHHGKRYVCVDARWLGENQQEPSIIRRKPDLVYAGSSNNVDIFRDQNNDQWECVGDSEEPRFLEITNRQLPNSVGQILEQVCFRGDTKNEGVLGIIESYIWTSYPWNLRICAIFSQHDGVVVNDPAGVADISVKCWKKENELGAYLFAIPKKFKNRLSFGFFGSGSPNEVIYFVLLENKGHKLLLTGFTNYDTDENSRACSVSRPPVDGKIEPDIRSRAWSVSRPPVDGKVELDIRWEMTPYIDAFARTTIPLDDRRLLNANQHSRSFIRRPIELVIDGHLMISSLFLDVVL